MLARELLDNDNPIREHLYNIMLYLGPLRIDVSPKEYCLYKNSAAQTFTRLLFLVGASNYLLKQEEENNLDRSPWFLKPRADKSLKILTDE